ncbi:keratin, type II cytoskeletal 1-like [Topomyia yanbarensis]|uniref:keratin, type II cytoskeletal 1-like n=1 Tax=Topomyia yanbarensis TaxID=2498891 RepID=UPI00273B915F|nr:keratin, type II cytoskeletal 1-like [Topomyia yanbarensis]
MIKEITFISCLVAAALAMPAVEYGALSPSLYPNDDAGIVILQPAEDDLEGAETAHHGGYGGGYGGGFGGQGGGGFGRGHGGFGGGFGGGRGFGGGYGGGYGGGFGGGHGGFGRGYHG